MTYITKTTSVISYSLRKHDNLVAIEHCQTHMRANFPLNKFSVIWNRLPANARNASAPPVFVSLVTRLNKDDNAVLQLTPTTSFSPHTDVLGTLNV